MQKRLVLAATFFTFFGVESGAWAQIVARLTAVQQTVEVRGVEAAGFKRAVVGTSVNAGDVIRTGRRSKVDIKFGDGSLIRLGQLSTVEVRGPRDMNLTAGQLLLSYLSPGRVQTASAAAEIKGTVATVEVDGDEATYSLYEGQLDVVTPKARQPVAAGHAVLAHADGTLSGLRSAAPLFYARDGAPLELLGTPENAPFVGSRVETFEKATSSAISARESGDDGAKISLRKKDKGKNGTVLDKDHSGKGKNRGGKGGNDSGNGGDDGNSGNGDGNSGSGNNDLLAATAFRAGTEAPLAISGPSNTNVASGRLFGTGTAPSGNPVLLAQLPLPSETTDATKTAAVANETGENQYLSAAALARLEQLRGSKGRTSGFDVRALGVAGDGGDYAYGARVHGYVAQGNWLLDGAVQPLRVHTSDGSLDLSAISDLSLTYRARAGEVQLGRQRFLSGPTQATLYGSLVRQGAREIMDAVRVSPKLSRNQALELAYIQDAYPRNLPYRINGAQHGFYARYALQRGANIGLNILRYNDLGTPSTLGASVDFAMPLVKRQIDLYGEAGRDTYKRRLTTLGLSFPGLYDKTGYDVYFEIANMGNSSLADRPPTEFALRAYRKVNDNLDLVGSVSRFSDGDTAAALGISIGSRIAN